MYGRYTQSLGEYAREQGLQLKEMEKSRKKEEKNRTKELRTYRGKWTSRILRLVAFVWRNTFAKIGEDWVSLPQSYANSNYALLLTTYTSSYLYILLGWKLSHVVFRNVS